MKATDSGPKGYRRLIPSLTGLLQFESVARKRSFTLAAQELGVTQAAVSKQVKSLEQLLGVSLFLRGHRSIELTSEGHELYAVVSQSMQRIATVFDRLSSEDVKHEVVLATTAAFSQFCVMPRIAELKARHPEIHLRLTTQMFTADLRSSKVDLAVRYGEGNWADGHAVWLFDEEVFPVCSPAWLAAQAGSVSSSQLAEAPLIAYDTTFEGWLGWEDWFQQVGLGRPKLKYALRCGLYTDAIQATLHSNGVALGWKGMLRDYLASGQLVRVTEASLKVKESYYAVISGRQSTTPALDAIIAWLRREAE